MLLDLIKTRDFSAEALIQLGLYIIVILISLSVHELFHGYVAYRCGDATARNLGRLTLNPLHHLDPLGTIMMLVFGFGYAKPVPINPRNFNHYKRDLCFVSFAGPLSNFCLAVIATFVYVLSMRFLPYNTVSLYWMIFCMYFMSANISLAIFNLLPIPPLDGSRILSAVLPGKIAYYYLRYEQYIMIIVLLLLWLGAFDGLLSFLSNGLLNFVFKAVSFILKPLLNLL